MQYQINSELECFDGFCYSSRLRTLFQEAQLRDEHISCVEVVVELTVLTTAIY